MFSWPMSYPSAKKFDGMILWWGSLQGPVASTGTYKVALNVNGKSQLREFRIIKAPNSEGNEKTVQSQFDFIKSVNDKVSEAHQAITDIRSLKAQVGSYAERTGDKEVKAMAEKMDSLATSVEQNLYQTKNKSNQDPLNFPIRLTNKLAHLNSLAGMGVNDFPPTAAMIEVRDELTQLIDAELVKWKEVKTSMLTEFNQLVKKKNLDVIILDKK